MQNFGSSIQIFELYRVKSQFVLNLNYETDFQLLHAHGSVLAVYDPQSSHRTKSSPLTFRRALFRACSSSRVILVSTARPNTRIAINAPMTMPPVTRIFINMAKPHSAPIAHVLLLRRWPLEPPQHPQILLHSWLTSPYHPPATEPAGPVFSARFRARTHLFQTAPQ